MMMHKPLSTHLVRLALLSALAGPLASCVTVKAPD
jgi:hypothetical protein